MRFLFLTLLISALPCFGYKQVCIIVNPISGGKNKEATVQQILQGLDRTQFETEVLYTQRPHHGAELAKMALNRHVDIVIAVGGDGTVHEIGGALIGSDTALAIIPTGSGNGLARHLGIPEEIHGAIQIINSSHIEPIDTVRINDTHYLGVAGIGFDAEVGWAFSEFGHRGFISYLAMAMKILPGYDPLCYNLSIDGRTISKEAFLISFANSSEFGNGAQIAPKALINDGYLDVVILKKVPFHALGKTVYQLFHGTLSDSKYIETYRCKSVKVNQENLKAQVDGEPAFFPHGIEIEIVPASLKIVMPARNS